MGVGHQALGLEGGEDRRVQPFRQLLELCGGLPGAVAGDDDGPPGLPDQGRRLRQRVLIGAGTAPCEPAVGPSGRGVAGLCLHLVGQHEVGDAPAVQGVLDRQRGQLGVVAAG
jgi:hypothetical protein